MVHTKSGARRMPGRCTGAGAAAELEDTEAPLHTYFCKILVVGSFYGHENVTCSPVPLICLHVGRGGEQLLTCAVNRHRPLLDITVRYSLTDICRSDCVGHPFHRHPGIMKVRIGLGLRVEVLKIEDRVRAQGEDRIRDKP